MEKENQNKEEKKQKGLLFIAHGSNVTASNQRVIDLTKKIAEDETGYVEIKAVFLELANPSVEDGIDFFVKKYSHIDLFPYFLAPGIHYRKDIPAILMKKKQQYPNCEFHLLDYLGRLPNLEQVLLQYFKNNNSIV